MAWSRKKIFLFTLLAILLISSVGGVVVLSSTSGPGIIINGIKISKDEFLWAMSRNRSVVIQNFINAGYSLAGSKLWENEVGGDVPYQVLADRALEDVIYIHAVLNLAYAHGYIESPGFKVLQDSCEMENKERKEKIAKGEPVYGVTFFDFNDYVDYAIDNLQKHYCSDTGNSGMEIIENERVQYYEENKERYYQQEDDIDVAYIKIDYYSGGFDDQIKKLEEQVNKLRESVLSGTAMGKSIESYSELKPYFHQQKVTKEEYSYYSRSIGDVLDLALDLKKGDVTQVIHQNGRLFLVQCIDRVDQDYIPYNQLINQINKSIKEDRYNQLINTKLKEVKVECQVNKMYRFSQKYINK